MRRAVIWRVRAVDASQSHTERATVLTTEGETHTLGLRRVSSVSGLKHFIKHWTHNNRSRRFETRRAVDERRKEILLKCGGRRWSNGFGVRLEGGAVWVFQGCHENHRSGVTRERETAAPRYNHRHAGGAGGGGGRESGRWIQLETSAFLGSAYEDPGRADPSLSRSL